MTHNLIALLSDLVHLVPNHLPETATFSLLVLTPFILYAQCFPKRATTALLVIDGIDEK